MHFLQYIIVAAFVVAFSAGGALAQGGPDVNRRAEGISVVHVPVVGNGAGTVVEIRGYASIHASNILTTVDASTEVEILINGTPLTQLIEGVTVTPAAGCAGINCGTQPCICHCPPNPCICECGPTTITSAPAQATLLPGDEIVVILRPAPGAAPDSNGSDDQISITYNGQPLFWQRRIVDVRFAPAASPPMISAPDSFFDITIDLQVLGNYEGTPALGGTIVVENATGTVLGQAPAMIPPHLSWLQCLGDCGGNNCMFTETIAGHCEPLGAALIPCPCQSVLFVATIPAVPMEPGDEITVILRPAPGALPELPGFPDPESPETVPCKEDCALPGPNGDVNVFDLFDLLSQWNNIGACDINADGIVDVFDLFALLSAWGACPGGPMAN